MWLMELLCGALLLEMAESLWGNTHSGVGRCHLTEQRYYLIIQLLLPNGSDHMTCFYCSFCFVFFCCLLSRSNGPLFHKISPDFGSLYLLNLGQEPENIAVEKH